MNKAKKIIVMTQLALYDKHHGKSDRLINEYFRHDYIYRKNLGNRLAVGSGAVVIMAIYWFRNIFIEGVEVFELYIRQHITDAVIFVLAVMAFYTVIGIIQGTREYFLVEQRLRHYEDLCAYLERVDERERMNSGEMARRRRPVRRQSPEARAARPLPGSRLDRPGARITRVTQDTTMRPPIERRPRRMDREALIYTERSSGRKPRRMDTDSRNALARRDWDS